MKIPFTIESLTNGTPHAKAQREISGRDWCWCCMELWPCREAEQEYTKSLEGMIERMVPVDLPSCTGCANGWPLDSTSGNHFNPDKMAGWPDFVPCTKE